MTVNIFDDLINSVIDCFNRAFDFETRSTRKEFWYWQFFRILMPSKTSGELFESKVEKLLKHKEILLSEHQCLNEVLELLLSKMSKVESRKIEQIL